MAYLEKYYISYCDDYNTTRRVSILKKDYVGSATELTADVNPISISYESSDDFMFSPIRPSTAEVFMIFDSESGPDFEEFWTADEKDYQIKSIKDGVTEWIGYVIPNGFSYEFKGGKYYASLQASDGLGTLESYLFIDDNDNYYGEQDLVYNDEFEFPFSLIITEILKKLSLDLDLWTCVDNYESAMTPRDTDTRLADPLSASYVNVKTYIKDSDNDDVPYWYVIGEAWNCKEVLENVLYIFGAKLYQESGVWRIKTINSDINYIEGNTPLNLLKYSEQIDNSYWLKNYVTVSPNAIAVTGTDYYGDKIIESTSVSSELHYIEGSYSKAASVITYTASVYVKGAERTKIQLRILGATGTENARVNFDTATQILDGGAANAPQTYISSSYSDEGDGWYRVSLTATSTAETSLRVGVLLLNGIFGGYIGDGTSGIYVRGMQLVEGSSVTSYYQTNNTATQRYWRKYNTAGTYLFDYETANDEVNVPCNSIETFMVGNDHVMSMDMVLKSFRMNYEYQVLRQGDSPINLLPNGDFCLFLNQSILAAPTGWYRWRFNTSADYIRLREITIPFADAGGHTCGIELGSQKKDSWPQIPDIEGNIKTTYRYTTVSSLQTSELQYVENNSLLTLDMWMKFKAKINNTLFAPMLRIVFYTVGGQKYYLRNNEVDGVYKLTWQNSGDDFTFDGNGKPIKDYINTYFVYFESSKSVNQPTETDYAWHQFQFELDNVPDAGWIEFNIHGYGKTTGAVDSQITYPYFRSWNLQGNNWQLTNKWLCVIDNVSQNNVPAYPFLQCTGFVLGIIRDENELPKQFDYIYENQGGNYTLQIDPITVYNGDLQDENHISNIKVYNHIYEGALGQPKNFWDDLSSSYGSSSLGLLVVRQIMRQYQKPYRILEGTIKIEDGRFGSVYTFSVLPGIRFILQRGTFNKQKGYIEDATFRQLSDDVLPDGGSEGGNSLLPEWKPTGVTYCETVNFLNTGYIIVQEQDVNPNSETYQDYREVRTDLPDTATCPVNQPNLYYWGSDDVYLNTATLSYFPFTQISTKEISISFDNDEGNYLYFVHLKSLGAVERITTLTTPNNVLADWVYTNDVIINGYLYRVLRTDYVMTEFTGFVHNFTFA